MIYKLLQFVIEELHMKVWNRLRRVTEISNIYTADHSLRNRPVSYDLIDFIDLICSGNVKKFSHINCKKCFGCK